jgi:Golgi SNAP receptor complex protein 2
MSQSISSLFPAAQRDALTASAALASYESGADSSQQAELRLHQTLESLGRACAEMDQAANTEPGSRRDMWRARVRGLQDELAVLRTAFTRAQRQNPHSSLSEQAASAAIRSQLFEGRSTQPSTLSAVDSFARQHDSLTRSNRFVDELAVMGSSALDSLRAQRSTLKGAHRKALDMANTLGMSNALMRIIGREDQVNAWITYGCMLFTVIVVLALWWFWRR